MGLGAMLCLARGLALRLQGVCTAWCQRFPAQDVRPGLAQIKTAT